jgi:superfamily I DNA/RNA helicase
MVDLGSLNPQQRQAVETIHGPVLILAGAGTGKTRVITFRIAHMIERGIAPEKILAVTFTNKAAREMQERVRQLVPAPRRRRGEAAEPAAAPERPTISTFHSLCVRILRRFIERLGYKRNFVIYDESDQLGAVKKILSRISDKGAKADAGAVLSLLSRQKNGGTHAAAFADPNVSALAEHVRKHYESALRACNAVDFDDLILLVLRLFKEHPDALDACREHYRYVMVDEYQDTNAAQFDLVRALTAEHRNLCAVGDDDQSIYGWRGAQIANLLDLEKHYPEVRLVKLEQNYRSTDTILNAANAVIQNNARRRGKRLWSRNGPGSKIVLCAYATDEAEAQGVVETIQLERMARRIPWSDQAILFRTNIQARPIETALRQAGVRYRLIGGQSFFDRREIKDFLAYLKMFVNPHDDVNLLRIANVPARGLSDVTMERLLAASQEHRGSVYDAMRRADVRAQFQARTQESLREFLRFIDQTRAPLASPDPAPLVPWAERFLAEIGYPDELRRSEKNPETAENRIQNLRDLVATLDKPERAPGPPGARLEAFLEDLTLDSGRDDKDDEAGDCVTLITVHSCKGLEFAHVQIVGLEEGLMPHARSKVEGTLDEERRLFYVALTRARRAVRLSYCDGRKRYGQMLPCHPSSFLKELPQELVEHEDAAARQPVTVDSGKGLFASLREALE